MGRVTIVWADETVLNKSAKTRQKFYKKRAKALKINAFALKIVREMRLELTQVLPH